MRKGSLTILIILFLFNLKIATAQALDTVRIDEMVLEAFFLQSRDLDSSYALALKVLKASDDLSYQKGIASAYMRMGSILNLKANNDSALLLLKRAYQIRLANKAYKSAAGSALVLNYVYQETGQIDSAFFMLYEGLRLNALISDTIGLIKINNNLGALHASYGELDEALQYYRRANDMARRNNYLEGIAMSSSGLGDYYYQLADFRSALNSFKKADSIYFALGDVLNRARSANNIALCYDQLDDVFEAKSYYQLALDAYEDLGNEREIALSLFNLGVLFDNQGQANSALLYFKKALPIARSAGDLDLISRVYEQTALANAHLGDFAEAYKYQERYTELRDTLLNSEKISSISEMQTRFETEQKEQQILLLGEQNRTKAAQRNFLIAGTILLLLGLFTLAYFYQQRQKLAAKNQELAAQRIENLINEQDRKSYNALIVGQEAERQRIAMDLHDRLGSMLSTVKLLFSALQSQFNHSEEGANQYEKATDLLDESCEEVRRVSHNLSTGMVSSLGLKKALNELCAGINQSGLVKCKLLIYGLDEALEHQTEVGIYRLVQETLNNSLKHSKASQITVQVNRLEEGLSITIEDNGVGFDPHLMKNSGKGMGLLNLEKRAEKLLGKYQIDSSPGRGSITMIEIPINQVSYD